MKQFFFRTGLHILLGWIMLSQIVISVLLFSIQAIADLDGIYNNLTQNKFLAYDAFSSVFLAVIEIMTIAIVTLFWLRRFSVRAMREHVRRIIMDGESDVVEFKETLRWDTKEKKYNKELEKVVLRSITGFLNAKGGMILIGVSDIGSVSGLESDYVTLPKQNKDGFQNHLEQIIRSTLGVVARKYLQISMHPIDKLDVCMIDIRPSQKPVYMKDGEHEQLYVRTGNRTHALSIREATDYINDRF